MTTKIHATCDALGNPTDFHLTLGQSHDLEGSDALLPKMLNKIGVLLPGKAYDPEERPLGLLRKAGVEIVIPPKRNRLEKREYDKDKYMWRHL